MLDKERNSTEYACKDNLKIFYLALTNYSELNNGKLPVKNNFAGLQELLPHGVSLENFYCACYRGEKYKNKDKKKNSKKTAFTEANSAYIYFGSINMKNAKNSVPKMIVMCDKFFNAKSGHLQILLLDGSVIELKANKLERIDKNGKSVKNAKLIKIVDLIDYLAEKYKYPQDIYRILRNKAKNMDIELKSADKNR